MDTKKQLEKLIPRTGSEKKYTNPKMVAKRHLQGFVPINGFEKYMINKDGVIFSSLSGSFLSTRRSTVNFEKPDGVSSNERVYKSIDKLVYEHFSDDVENLSNLCKFSVKHLDGDKFNNNINNLALVSPKQYLQKRKKEDNCSSKYIGVSWRKHCNKWVSKIEINGKTYHLGQFLHAENGAYVYDRVAKHFKDPAFYHNETIKDVTLPDEHENRENIINKMIDKINEKN